MIAEGISPKKLVCIYNSLDYDQHKIVRKNLTYTSIYKEYFRNAFPVLLYIGRIQLSKRLDLLIRAMEKMHVEGQAVNLIIVGDDNENTGIRNLIKETKLTNFVWLYGATYDEKIIGELIYNADLCISPGNVGLTAIHSLTYGTPVITHNKISNQGPEFEAIELGLTGDFFIENDILDLIRVIKKWISIEPEKRNTVREEAYKIIDSKYNPHYQLKVIESLLPPRIKA